MSTALRARRTDALAEVFANNRSWWLWAPAFEGRNKKAPDIAGTFESSERSEDQYFATNGPPQLKR